MATPAPDTLRGELLRLAHVGLDLHEYAPDAVRVLRRAVQFDGVAVVAFDPATGLPVDTWADNSEEIDLDAFRQLAASGRRAARSGRKLRTVCVNDSGMWGAIVLRRERGAPDFLARDVALLASLADMFDDVQRARLQRDVPVNGGDRDAGLLLLDDEDDIEMANAAAAAWLDELRGHRRLPLVVTAVADRARALASGHGDGAATARARTTTGRWVLVRGSVLCNGTRARTMVTLEPARAPELAGLRADAYGLTARERRVTELVAQGLPSAAIAARLHLSTYTVQDHLKAIFEKLDVSNRGALVARLFLDPHQVDGRLSVQL
jgi:DNA-binding CsgD family transcriptional regulator